MHFTELSRYAVSLLASIVLGASLAAPATAQCAAYDGLDGLCCQPANLLLPNLPPVVLEGVALQFTDCGTSDQQCIDLELGPPVPTDTCSAYTASCKVVECGGQAVFEAQARLDYSRTWNEQGPNGPLEVWRFLIKLDAELAGPAASELLPPCITTEQSGFYYGYVDYAKSCASGVVQSVVVLFHGCDRLQHRPGLSVNPGVFHPDRSFAIVAPADANQPFAPGVQAPVGGSITGDGLRTLTPFSCQTESSVLQGVFQPLGSGCLCGGPGAAPQMAGFNVTAATACATDARSLNLTPATPWPGLLSISLGSWTNPMRYPGTETVRVAEGLFEYRDSCPAGGTRDFEVFYGAETLGGLQRLPVEGGGADPSEHLLDLAGNWRNAVGAPLALPAIGEVHPTRHVISLDID